jgi:hypothetical protein
MMLCEGNDITQALGAMTRLVMMLPRVSCKPEAKAYV